MKSADKLNDFGPIEGGAAAAGELAMRALAFLTTDEDRLLRFLALTGLDAGDVRGLLGERGFHLAILDHIAADEPLLMAFVDQEALPPQMVGRARRALGGGDDF
jgi:hypothetical protein